MQNCKPDLLKAPKKGGNQEKCDRVLTKQFHRWLDRGFQMPEKNMPSLKSESTPKKTLNSGHLLTVFALDWPIFLGFRRRTVILKSTQRTRLMMHVAMKGFCTHEIFPLLLRTSKISPKRTRHDPKQGVNMNINIFNTHMTTPPINWDGVCVRIQPAKERP